MTFYSKHREAEMDIRITLRLGAAAGWVAFVGVVGGLIVIPTVIAGQPPTIRTPAADVARYFAHPEFVGLFAVVATLLAGVPIIPFGLGIRAMAGEGSARSRVLAELGFLLLIATVPVYVVSDALGAVLAASQSDAAVFGSVHQLYELLYNGSADALEGAWIGAFSLAMLDSTLPRWLGWLGVVLAASRWVKAFVPVTSAVPDAVITVSGVLFLAWFLAVVIALTRRALRPAERVAAAAAAA
jgi:hypothetical protein